MSIAQKTEPLRLKLDQQIVHEEKTSYYGVFFLKGSRQKKSPTTLEEFL